MSSNFPPEGSVRFTANMPIEVHTRMKVMAAKRNLTMGELALLGFAIIEAMERHGVFAAPSREAA